MERFWKVCLTALALSVGSANAANFTVAMTDAFTYSPKDLAVNVGDTVTWMNQSFSLHDTVSGVAGVQSGFWKSPLLTNGGSFSFTFNVAPGNYPYYCTPHYLRFGMVGSITVLPPNMPPSVSVTNPQNGAKFTTGANALIEADASDDNGVTRVEFFVNGNLIATDFTAPYSASLTNVALGNYSLTASAFDAEGLFTTSAAVNISAQQSPTIAITQPTEGARFGLGTNVFAAAEVTVAGLAATSVQFFESDGTNSQAISPPLMNAPYDFLWRPQIARPHRLQAIVTDEAGGTTPSSFVNVEVFDPGTKNPTIAITEAPPNFSRATNSTLPISGIAGDDIRLDYVEFQVNDGPFVRANGTSNWTAQVGLTAATNVVNFRSVDFAGNFSTNDTRTFTYIVNSPTVLVRGAGTLLPNLNGKLLELGKFYQMIARPGLGQIFGGWSGTTNSNKAVLNFPMNSNLVLIASFIPNPFPNVKGTYTGLIFETNNVRPESSGAFKVRVTSRGAFSGRLTIHNKTYPWHGQLDHSGSAKVPVLRRPIRPVVVTLHLDLTSTSGMTGAVTDGDWVSQLQGGRIVPVAKSDRASHIEKFNFMSDGEKLASVVARMESTLKISGQFLDGEKFAQTLWPIESGECPFYFASRSGGAVFLGWLNFPNDFGALFDDELIRATTNGVAAVVDFVPVE